MLRKKIASCMFSFPKDHRTMCDVGGAGWQSGHRNSGDTAEERAGFKAGDFVEETLGGGAIPPCRTTQPFVILYRKKKGTHLYL